MPLKKSILRVGLFWILLFGIFGFQNTQNPTVDAFFETPKAQLRSFDFSEFDIEQLHIAFQRSEEFILHPSERADVSKGHLYLAYLSDHIKKEIDNGQINPRKKNVRALLQKFKAHQYHIHQPKTPNVVKLAHYLCEGQYQYIYSRFKVSSIFMPVIIVLTLLILLCLINAFGRVKWKYKRLLNKLVVIVLTCLVIALIIFKLTCNDFVQTDSLYGIYF